MCMTGLKIRHVGERFQRANATISKYFKRVLLIVSSPLFYTKYVYLPQIDDPLDPFLASNPKFTTYFPGAQGAMDGTHIPCCPSILEAEGAHNCKGSLSQNCLAACTWGGCCCGWDNVCSCTPDRLLCAKW
ncbi:hypothetical protein OH77DRAFT_1577479 [Trametes cingulata]|nr:hypothetical protein OH77DRAFT_1577479 [Trametes cingulata]